MMSAPNLYFLILACGLVGAFHPRTGFILMSLIFGLKFFGAALK